MTELLTVGVDVGGTKIETALINQQGEILASYRSTSGSGMDVDQWVAGVKDAIAELCAGVADERIGAIGVGFAGQIDPATGAVKASPNIGWRNVPVRARLQDAVNKPVTVVNDVQSATWAEWKRGAGRKASHLVCIFVGTGIGGGIIIGGKLYKGAAGSAGEIGHTVVDLNGPPCKCGASGCLEAHAGGWAIAVRAQEAVARDPDGGRLILGLVGGDAQAVDAAALSQAAHQGDPFALQLVQRIGEDLGAGVVSVVNMLNPEMVILGGGVIDGLPWLVEIVEKVVQEQALEAATGALRIAKAELANYAPVIGAGLLAQELL